MKREKLRQARIKKGLSQQVAAELIGVSRNAWSLWEQGKENPYPVNVKELCTFFSVDDPGDLDLQPRPMSVSKDEKAQSNTNGNSSKDRGTSLNADNEKREALKAKNEHPKFGLLSYNSAKSLLEVPRLDMLIMPRRQVLKEILNAACAALLLSPYRLLSEDIREHLEMMTVRSSYVDEEAVNELATITQSYWVLSKNASIDLLSGIAGHFTILTQLLKESHPAPIYERLYTLAGENALLLGKTFHDIREYNLAWEYYKFSMRIAQDTHNTELWANGVGRIALLLIYWGQPRNALPLLHEAQKKEIHNQRLKPWLAAIEAEIHAMQGDINNCQRSLERAKSVQLPVSLADDIYVTGFNPSRAAGYEGSCFVRLHQPELALPALEKAFVLCDPTSIRRRSTLLADRGTVYAQLGDVQTACSLLLQALDMTVQTKSLVVLQRIYKGRGALDPWKDSTEVKNLDERVFEMLTTLTNLKEQVYT